MACIVTTNELIKRPKDFETAPLPADLLQLVCERSYLYPHCRYDPWVDMFRRTGVELRWHNAGTRSLGSMGYDNAVFALTCFDELWTSLRIGLNEVQLRSALAHELAHLDRGPQLIGSDVQAEEDRVDLLAAQRLIDPVIFDALMDATDGTPSSRAQNLTLFVDKSIFKSYSQWRAGVTAGTARSAWRKALQPTPWPAPWIEKWADDLPLAAAFAGCDSS